MSNQISRLEKINNFLNSKSHLVLYIPLTVIIFKALGAFLAILHRVSEIYGFQVIFEILPIFSVDNTANFFESFIEWFGILYGFLMPLILVRVWEQFDEIDKEFDKEADAVKILSENIRLMHKSNSELGNTIIDLLIKYVNYVKENYNKESIEGNIRVNGDKILREIREKFKYLIHPTDKKRVVEPDALISELIKQLDNIIDIRGDRISLSSERLFDVLRTIGLVASIMFLIPFYYVGFTPNTGIMEIIMVIGITILVILIYIIVDDLDDPFAGIWKIEPESWDRVLEDLNSEKKGNS